MNTWHSHDLQLQLMWGVCKYFFLLYAIEMGELFLTLSQAHNHILFVHLPEYWDVENSLYVHVF